MRRLPLLIAANLAGVAVLTVHLAPRWIPVDPYCVGEHPLIAPNVDISRPAYADGPIDPSPEFTLGGKAYFHPVLWAQTGLGLLQMGLVDDAKRLADELWDHQQDGWLPYEYDWPSAEQRAPWYSAMAQGEALRLFVELDQLDRAAVVFATLADSRVVAEDGWLLEYPGYEPVLNGAIFAVFGIYRYWQATGDDAARDRLIDAIEPIARDIHRFRTPGGISSYERDGDNHNPIYHRIHVNQLYYLAQISRMACLERAAGDFDADS